MIEELKTEIREDLEEKVSEQERKIANNTDQSMKNEILFHNIEAMVADQKNEMANQKNEMAKQKNETANMLSAIFSNIIGVVRADEARIQELEGKISRNLEDKMATQDTNIAKNLDLIGTFSRAVSINEARVANNSYLIGAVSQEVKMNEAAVSGIQDQIKEQEAKFLREVETRSEQDTKIADLISKVQEQDTEIGRNTDLIGKVREDVTSNAANIEQLPSLEQMKESIGKGRLCGEKT